MKTYVVFSSKEPLLIVTRGTIRNRKVIDHLNQIGYRKFISREVPLDNVRRQYGTHFDIVEKALAEGNEVRVLDFNGEHVFGSIPFSDYGRVFCYDSTPPLLKRPAPGSSRTLHAPDDTLIHAQV